MKSGNPILHRLKHCLSSYTGLVWAVPVYRKPTDTIPLRSVGDIAGYVRKDGYAGISIDGYGEFMCHRLIWELVHGDIPDGLFVDHIDGNRLNNNPLNFRLVVKDLNARNIKMMSTNTSGVTGVSYDDKGSKQYWKAKWRKGGKPKTANFCINTLGNEEAFRLACEYRAKMIEDLNAQGAGYTDTHGKR